MKSRLVFGITVAMMTVPGCGEDEAAVSTAPTTTGAPADSTTTSDAAPTTAPPTTSTFPTFPPARQDLEHGGATWAALGQPDLRYTVSIFSESEADARAAADAFEVRDFHATVAEVRTFCLD